jgi:hypothetical protein
MSSHGGRLYPEERTASADGYPSACTFCTFVLQSDCRLRHSGSLERDSSPTGTFPTEWPGSQQERHVGVKHSWSINNASCSASLGKNGALVSCPGEATSLGACVEGFRDVSCDEAEAVLASGVQT